MILSTTEQTLIKNALDLFAYASGIPITFYLVEKNNQVKEISHSEDQHAPAYCHEIWKLNGGEMREVCRINMCGRAGATVSEKVTDIHECHAGLTSVAEPILNDANESVVAVIQYGALLLNDEDQPEGQLDRTVQAIIELGASESEAAEISELMVQKSPINSRKELEQVQKTLPPLLKRIIVDFISQREVEHRSQQLAYHELHMRHQAAIAHAENLFMAMPVDSPFRERIEDIMGSVEAGATVMHGLTRGRYLPQQYRFRIRDIEAIIDRAIILCRTEARKKGVQIHSDCRPRNFKLELSERHIQQAFNNIIQNAVKYSYFTTSRSRERFVSIKGKRKNNGYQVSITNYGVGILEDEYDKIFQGAYKGKLTRAEYRTGAGLGLFLSKEIIEAHHGTIVPQSDPVQTLVDEEELIPYLTHFTIWLPAKQGK